MLEDIRGQARAYMRALARACCSPGGREAGRAWFSGGARLSEKDLREERFPVVCHRKGHWSVSPLLSKRFHKPKVFFCCDPCILQGFDCPGIA